MGNRILEIDGCVFHYEYSKVSYNEALNIAEKRIKDIKKKYTREDGTLPKVPQYVTSKEAVYKDVPYILTTKGWLNDEQRSQYIRRMCGEDYEIIEPFQQEVRREFSHYTEVRKCIGSRDMTLEELFKEEWLMTGEDLQYIKESEYPDTESKPFEYLTEDELSKFCGEPVLSNDEDEYL